MAPSIKCLSYKHKGPGLISRTHIKLLEMVSCICNPCTGSQRQEDPGACWLASLAYWWASGQCETLSQRRWIVFLRTLEVVLWPPCGWMQHTGKHFKCLGLENGLVVKNTVAHAESLSLCSGTHLMVHTICNSSSKGSDSLFWPPKVPAMHVAHLLTGKNLICIKSKIFIENKMKKRDSSKKYIWVYLILKCSLCIIVDFYTFLKTVMDLYVSMCVCTHVWGGQRTTRGSWFYLLPCGSHRSNSGRQS